MIRFERIIQYMRYARDRRMTANTGNRNRADELGRLWWLVDAPLFIDHSLVDRLHDAIVWPETVDQYTEEITKRKVNTAIAGQAEAEGGGEVRLPAFLDWLGPKLDARAKAATQASRNTEDESASVVRGRPVNNSERRLNELVVEYLRNFPDRILFFDAPGGNYRNIRGEVKRDSIQAMLDSPPRPIIFLDVMPFSPIFPTMIEMENGGFRPVYKALEERFRGAEKALPSYPSKEDDLPAKKAYWSALEDKFRSRVAMEAIEDACEEGRIGWIDFRLLFSEDGETLHLHLVPAGRYHTGVFGYNFVHRGHKFGCRIVGSLKQGFDVNVMAIYDR